MYRKVRLIFIIIIIFILCYKMIKNVDEYKNNSIDFNGFNNETGVAFNIVPNLIHFIRFNQTNFSFVDIVVIRAAHLAQKPDAIYIHSNVKTFEGKYWIQLQNKWPDTYKLIKIIPRELPLTIYNRSLSIPYHLHHASDIVRYRLLAEYGGIFLDNDLFIIQNLDKYRKFEMTIEWNPNRYMGNQLLIGHKNARFLQHCIETFRDYRSDLWYYNGGELPTTAVLFKHPQFIHRVIHKFGTDIPIFVYLYRKNWSNWKKLDAIHLLINHRSYLFKEDYKLYPEFDEHNILNHNSTFGEMMRSIYFG